MGCASSAQPQPPPNNPNNNNNNQNARTQTAPAGSVGNSIPLKEPQRWSSKRKISRQQLEGKREEFWHTCQATNVPAVWQQLKTVCEVMSSGDLATASAICQAANIITPEGSLTRCYDQFGNLVRLLLEIYLIHLFGIFFCRSFIKFSFIKIVVKIYPLDNSFSQLIYFTTGQQELTFFFFVLSFLAFFFSPSSSFLHTIGTIFNTHH